MVVLVHLHSACSVLSHILALLKNSTEAGNLLRGNGSVLSITAANRFGLNFGAHHCQHWNLLIWTDRPLTAKSSSGAAQFRARTCVSIRILSGGNTSFIKPVLASLSASRVDKKFASSLKLHRPFCPIPPSCSILGGGASILLQWDWTWGSYSKYVLEEILPKKTKLIQIYQPL